MRRVWLLLTLLLFGCGSHRTIEFPSTKTEIERAADLGLRLHRPLAESLRDPHSRVFLIRVGNGAVRYTLLANPHVSDETLARELEQAIGGSIQAKIGTETYSVAAAYHSETRWFSPQTEYRVDPSKPLSKFDLGANGWCGVRVLSGIEAHATGLTRTGTFDFHDIYLPTKGQASTLRIREDFGSPVPAALWVLLSPVLALLGPSVGWLLWRLAGRTSWVYPAVAYPAAIIVPVALIAAPGRGWYEASQPALTAWFGPSATSGPFATTLLGAPLMAALLHAHVVDARKNPVWFTIRYGAPIYLGMLLPIVYAGFILSASSVSAGATAPLTLCYLFSPLMLSDRYRWDEGLTEKAHTWATRFSVRPLDVFVRVGKRYENPHIVVSSLNYICVSSDGATELTDEESDFALAREAAGLCYPGRSSLSWRKRFATGAVAGLTVSLVSFDALRLWPIAVVAFAVLLYLVVRADNLSQARTSLIDADALRATKNLRAAFSALDKFGDYLPRSKRSRLPTIAQRKAALYDLAQAEGID